MTNLAMNDRGVSVLRVAHDVLPDVQHGSASGVDERAALRGQPEHFLDGDPEGRQDDHVVGADLMGALDRVS